MDKYDVRSRFARLFEGRHDAYGTDTGGAARSGDPVFGGQPDRHLRGECAIGVYPIYDEYEYPKCKRCAGSGHVDTDFDDRAICGQCRGDGTGDPRNIGSHVRWGAVDFDIKSDHHKSYDYETEDEAHVAATDLQRVLAALGITAWIERTRSHGRHVWVFASLPVPAATMRRALLVACSLAEVSAREVNPKSEVLAPDQLGNYVRLAYAGGERDWSGPSDVARRATGRRGGFLSAHEAVRDAVSEHLTADDGPRRSGASEGSDGPGRLGPVRLAQCSGCGASWLRGEGHLPLASAEPARRSGVDDDAVPADGGASTSADQDVPCRVAIDADQAPLCLTCFVEQAYASRVAPDVLTEIAAHWQPPPEIEVRVVAPYQGALRDITTKLDGQGFVVFRDGPTTGDRSGGLVYLAHSCARSGLTHDECVTLLLDADARWGKFSKRHDCERQIGLIAGRAYG